MSYPGVVDFCEEAFFRNMRMRKLRLSLRRQLGVRFLAPAHYPTCVFKTSPY